jgi:hypothetical protein
MKERSLLWTPMVISAVNISMQGSVRTDINAYKVTNK